MNEPDSDMTPSPSSLTFDHHDGPLVFPVRRAVYAVSPEGQFSCSIECGGNPALDHLSEPAFCFMRCPIDAPPLAVGTVLRIAARQGERDDFDQPSTHLYAREYFDPWEASVTVLAMRPGALEVDIRFMTDDPNNYGPDARDTPCRCRVWLHEVPVDQVRDLM